MRVSWVLLAVVGCGRGEAPPQRSSLAQTNAVVQTAPRAPSAAERDADLCRQRIDQAMGASSLPGAPAFEDDRALILARAKAHPSLLVREPTTDASLSEPGKTLRRRIAEAAHPSFELYSLYPTLRRHPARAREVLLTQGYLYSSHPALAHALTTVVHLRDLFRSPELFVQRGNDVLKLKRVRIRGEHHYVHTDGPEAGQLAKVLLLDRVVTSPEDLEHPLHRSVSEVRVQLGFDRLTVRRITSEHLLVDAHYGDLTIPTLLRTTGALAELECERVEPARVDDLAAARGVRQEHQRYVAALREVVEQMIDERLPFDEPKTEVGQQDGKLRQHWNWACRFGHSRFDFNDDTYPVFDTSGRPRVPQVCIDFITDTFERASGSWYLPRGQGRSRRPGRFTFDDYEMDNRRSVESFITLAEAIPAAFEVLHLAPTDQIPLRRRSDFYAFLAEHREDFVPGDVVVILGLRDDDKEHYHSFFVVEADPVTAMPTLLASNAGRPRVRSWEDEMSNAPKRSIRTRIRPRIEWLREVVELPRDVAMTSAPGTLPPI